MGASVLKGDEWNEATSTVTHKGSYLAGLQTPRKQSLSLLFAASSPGSNVVPILYLVLNKCWLNVEKMESSVSYYYEF